MSRAGAQSACQRARSDESQATALRPMRLGAGESPDLIIRSTVDRLSPGNSLKASKRRNCWADTTSAGVFIAARLLRAGAGGGRISAIVLSGDAQLRD